MNCKAVELRVISVCPPSVLAQLSETVLTKFAFILVASVAYLVCKSELLTSLLPFGLRYQQLGANNRVCSGVARRSLSKIVFVLWRNASCHVQLSFFVLAAQCPDPAQRQRRSDLDRACPPLCPRHLPPVRPPPPHPRRPTAKSNSFQPNEVSVRFHLFFRAEKIVTKINLHSYAECAETRPERSCSQLLSCLQ